ncbi:DNA-protecting protein DprA [Saccharopolyspora phatthalungensis]|uniref:DNA recombination-mediator protein A n=1 Tax=Saccharopolyspora phatthalungensis TaxID=664693 RepID=A0A840QB27_9PSEU|nr:DNA-protecting protein DprA [Saccharopolyspora phatthalungensis]MBB5157964.1 hypothetical protein [Saccharopolyspora phatthalungensis]
MTTEQFAELFRCYLAPFSSPNAHVYLGGAIGIDTEALVWLAEHTRVALTVAVPCVLADQPEDAVNAVRHWQERKRVKGIVELGAPSLGTVAYHARNRWMVDRSDFVIGFPRGDVPSGTWYTINYAAEKGKPRLVVPI